MTLPQAAPLHPLIIPSGLSRFRPRPRIDNTAPIGYAATGPLSATNHLFCRDSEVFAVARDNPASSTVTDWAGMRVITFTASSGVSLLGEVSVEATQGPTVTMKTSKLSVPGTATSLQVTAKAADFAGNEIGSANNLVNFTSLASTDPDTRPCKAFTDIAGTEWFAVYVRYLATAGLIEGFGDGTFRPNDPVTRAQLAKLLVASLGLGLGDLPTAPPSAACTFSDVTGTEWFAGWVWKAYDLGLMVGVGGGKFAPNDPVTRGQAATAIDRLKNQTGGFVTASVVKNETRTLRGDPPFTDLVSGAFYEAAVKRLYNIGVVDGTTPTTFSPDAQVTRGQIAKLLYRALGKRVQL